MFISLALIFLGGLLCGAIAQRLRLPSLFGMLLFGILISTHGLNLLPERFMDLSADLRKMALVIILTKAGLSLKFNDLKKAGLPAILLSFVPASFEIAAVCLVAPRLLGISLQQAFLMGCVLAAVSPAVVVPRMVSLMERGLGVAKGIPQMILTGASLDDVFVIILFSAGLEMQQGTSFQWSQLAQIPLSIVNGIGIGVLVGYLLILIFRHFTFRNTIKLLLLLSVSFFLLEFQDVFDWVFPFSSYLAIMTSGLIIRRMRPGTAVKLASKYGKIWVGAEVLLFVLVGSVVDIRVLQSAGLPIMMTLVLILLGRTVGVLLSLAGSSLNKKERLFVVLGYLPKATVQAAIGAIPLQMGLPGGEMILTAAVLAILITAPVGAFLVDTTQQRLLEQEVQIEVASS